MEKAVSKRYLITFDEKVINTEKVSAIIRVSSAKIKDGSAFMATDSVMGHDDILHFGQLGITNIALSEVQAKKLSSNRNIIAIEEDCELTATEQTEAGNEFFNDIHDSSVFGSGLTSNKNESFDDGYDQALTDIFSKLLKIRRKAPHQLGSFLNTEILHKLPFNSKFPDFQKLPELMPFRFQPIPWNIQMIKAPAAWCRGITGKDIPVAILDSGIAAHPDLVISGGTCMVPGITGFNDQSGTGTHNAGIVAARNNFIGVIGVAPMAKIYAVKVLNNNGSGMNSWIIAGIEWCISNGIKVIGMGLGGTQNPSIAYSMAIKRCQDSGITVVIKAGTTYGTSFPWVNSPANSIIQNQPNSKPIAVGAITQNSTIAGFSSRGGQTPLWNNVFCVAPGVNIISTHLGGNYMMWAGTAEACMHVVGLVALLNQRFPAISTPIIKQRIAATSTDLGVNGFDIAHGFGLINCDKATL